MYINKVLDMNQIGGQNMAVLEDGSIGFTDFTSIENWESFIKSDCPVVSHKYLNGGYKYRYGLSFAHRDQLLSREIIECKNTVQVIEDYRDSVLTYEYRMLRVQAEEQLKLSYQLEMKDSFNTCRTGVALREFGKRIHNVECINMHKIKETNKSKSYHAGPGEVFEGGFIIKIRLGEGDNE